RSRCARPAGRARRRCPRPRASTVGRAHVSGAGTPPSGSGAVPPPRSWRSGSRTSAPRSSQSTPRRGHAGRRRRRAASHGARDSRAPRPRRRRRRDRGARGSSSRASYCWLVIVTPPLAPPAIEQPAPRQVSYGLVTGRAPRGTTHIVVSARGRTLVSKRLAGHRFSLRENLPLGDVIVRVTTVTGDGRRPSARVRDVFGLPASARPP